MLRWMTAGESHGPALLATIEGLPSGLHVTTEDLHRGLARHRLGYGRGARQKLEADGVSILAGVHHDVTIGAPVAIRIGSSEWPKWETVIGADPVDPLGLLIDAGTGDEREIVRNRPLTRPRPGHVDLPGMPSYDLSDARPILERTGTRETTARAALGALAETLLEQVAGVRLVSYAVSAGAQYATASLTSTPAGEAALCETSTRTFDPEDNARFGAAVDTAKQASDAVGGVTEVIAYGVPVGLGTHVTACGCLDVRLAAVLVSVQSTEGVETRDGFARTALLGSAAHDEIARGGDDHLTRASNHTGGIEGGTSNDAPIVAHAAFKPISTVPHALRNANLAAGEEAVGLHQRSDTYQVVPNAVIVGAEVALVLADAPSDHTGGRSIGEMRRSLKVYLAVVGERA